MISLDRSSRFLSLYKSVGPHQVSLPVREREKEKQKKRKKKKKHTKETKERKMYLSLFFYEVETLLSPCLRFARKGWSPDYIITVHAVNIFL